MSHTHILHRARRWTVAASVGIAALAGLVAGGCGPTRPAAPPAGATVDVPANSFSIAWRANLPLPDNTRLQRVRVIEDAVIAYAADYHCYWVGREQGSILNSAVVGAAPDALFDPISAGDVVAIPSTRHLSVFNRNGKYLHEVPLRDAATSGGSAAEGLIYIGVEHAHGGRLSAVPSREQPYVLSPPWEMMTRGQIVSAPAIYQKQVYVGSRDGGVYAVKAGTHEVLWSRLEGASFRTGGEILADLAVDRDGLYVASSDSKLYCLELATGKLKWVCYTGGSLRAESDPVAMADFVYVYVPTRGLAAVPKGGTSEIRQPSWIVPEGRQLLSADDSYAYIRAADNSILAVARQTGQVAFRSKTTTYTLFASNVSGKDNRIYAGHPSGTVVAIRPVLKGGSVGELVLEEAPAETVAAR